MNAPMHAASADVDAVHRTGSGRPRHARRRGPRRDAGGAAAADPPASGWRSCCTTCSGCRSTRSPRRWAGPSAPAASSRVAHGRSSPPPRRGSPTSPMPNISSSPRRFITACANGDLEALTAVLDPTVWGVGTVLAEPAPPPQVNHGPDAVGRNLLRYLGRGATLVSGPVGQPVLLAFADRRLFAVIVLTVRDNLFVRSKRRSTRRQQPNRRRRSGCAGVFGCGRD